MRQKTQRCRTKANDLRKLSQEKQAHNKSLVISLDRETHYSTRGVYSKMMLEDILRSFYCVMQMEELWEKGRELHIEYIVEKLPTKAEIRLMSKS